VESVIDLHPPGYESSIAWAVAGNSQVGNGDGRALLWHGSAASVVDLHAFLTDLPVTIVRSFAQGVDEHGDVVGVGFDNDGYARAILWNLIPEPSTSTICLILLIGAALCRPPIALHRCNAVQQSAIDTYFH
jgi:hypothetical protein